jgi:hypothetical protein
MAKKHPSPTTTSKTDEAATATPPTTSAETAKPADVVRVEQAFAVGNYAAVRRAAVGEAGPARDAAVALLPRVVVEPVQVLVGVVALVVVLTVCAATLH